MSLFICYPLKNKFFPFLKGWRATIPCRKDDKVGKLLINKKGKEKKRESDREGSKQIRKSSQNFGLCTCVKNKKNRLITSDQSENMPFLMQKSFLAILLAMLISRKPIQTRGIFEKMRFFRYSPAVTKGLKKVTNLFRIGLFPHKKVKFAHCSTKQVCNVKEKNLLCLIKVNGNFFIQMIEISVEQASFKSKVAVAVTSYMTSSHLD